MRLEYLKDPHKLHPVWRVALSIVLVGAALAFSIAFEPVIRSTPYAMFFGAVALAAWLGGLTTGLLVTVLSVVAADYYLIPPLGRVLSAPTDLAHVAIFVGVAMLISWIDHARRQSLRYIGEVRDELQALMDNTADAITAQDATGKVIFANKAAAELTGYASVSEMLNQSVSSIQRRYEMFDERGEPLSFSQLPRNRVFREGVGGAVRFRMHYVDDHSDRWIDLSSAPVFDANHKPRLAVNVFRDITESMQQHSRLAQILDNLPALVGMLTPDGILIEANRVALRLANLQREDVLGKPFAETYWWSYDEVVKAQLQDAIRRAREGALVQYDVRVRVGEGTFATIDFSLSPILDDAGKVTALLARAVDITDRLRMERERAELTALVGQERTRLETILSHIPGIVWEGIGEPDGSQRVLYVNRYAETVLGYPVERWYQKPSIWPEIVVSDDMPDAIERAMGVSEGGSPNVIEFRLKASDGRIIPVESFTAVVGHDPHDGRTHRVGVIMDISQRKRNEALLKRYMARLKSSNEELQQFAYVASHDLQEPLRMVSSYLQLIEARYSELLDQDGKEFIDFAVDGANRMKQLIQDLLVYSRVETRQGRYTSVDMNDIIRQVQSNLALTIAETETTLEADELPKLVADQGQMVQLVQNLVSNAIKFRSQKAPTVRFTAERIPGYWQFAIQDNGIGIEPKYQDRIFVIFQRLHGHGKYPGTGIGLAICKRVVERHGGRIWFSSEPGEGTTFYFTIATHLQSGGEDDEYEIA
ncbi:MAG: PAS domain S-box protein [Chloroflexi bacterium]|nr:PAS domain S-box protein [Chloroflexota bacterium]